MWAITSTVTSSPVFGRTQAAVAWVEYLQDFRPFFSLVERTQYRQAGSFPTALSAKTQATTRRSLLPILLYTAQCVEPKHIWGGINITYPVVTDVGSLLKPRSTDDARENEAWPRVGKEVGRSMEDLVPGTDPRNSPVLWRLMFVCLTCSIDGENFTSNNNVNDTLWNSFQNPNPPKFPVSVST